MALHSFRNDRKVLEKPITRELVQRVIGFARPYRRQLVVFIVLTAIASLIAVVPALLFGKLIDDAIPPGDTGLVITIALVVAALAVLDGVISLVTRFYSASIGEGLIYDLRGQVFEHVQRMPIAFFTRTQTGALVSRLNSDVIGAQRAFTSTLSGVLSNGIGLIVTVTAMATRSWLITLLSLVLLPVFIVPARRVGARLQEITREGMVLNAEMNNTMTERFNVSGALLVKLFGRPHDEAESFRARAGRVRDIGVRSSMYSGTFFVSLTLVASLATAITYGFGGTLAVRGDLSPGDVVVLATLLRQLYGPLTALSNIRVDIMTALVSFERVIEVLDLPPLIRDKDDAIELANAATSIEFEQVDFRYPTPEEVSLASLESVAVTDSGRSAQVLHDVSFRIEPGQMVALVGPSGAGKTTISMLPTRMYDVQAGAVRVGGHDVRDLTLSSLTAAIGAVTQEAHLFHDTIRANLLYARPRASQAELEAACRDAQIHDLIASLPDGYDTVVGDRGYRLSGGEKQRLAIARLLLKAPGIMILDEATAHLDSESELAVQLALRNALQGRTSIVIAHRLSTIREADLILVVDGGRVVQQGTHEQLVRSGGLYSELYRTQFAPQTTVA
jgi:ATP-binding cassette subfamily B protein